MAQGYEKVQLQNYTDVQVSVNTITVYVSSAALSTIENGVYTRVYLRNMTSNEIVADSSYVAGGATVSCYGATGCTYQVCVDVLKAGRYSEDFGYYRTTVYVPSQSSTPVGYEKPQAASYIHATQVDGKIYVTVLPGILHTLDRNPNSGYARIYIRGNGNTTLTNSRSQLISSSPIYEEFTMNPTETTTYTIRVDYGYVPDIYSDNFSYWNIPCTVVVEEPEPDPLIRVDYTTSAAVSLVKSYTINGSGSVGNMSNVSTSKAQVGCIPGLRNYYLASIFRIQFPEYDGETEKFTFDFNLAKESLFAFGEPSLRYMVMTSDIQTIIPNQNGTPIDNSGIIEIETSTNLSGQTRYIYLFGNLTSQNSTRTVKNTAVTLNYYRYE